MYKSAQYDFIQYWLKAQKMVDGTLSQSLDGHNQIYTILGGSLNLSILSQVLCAEPTSDWIVQIPNKNNANGINSWGTMGNQYALR